MKDFKKSVTKTTNIECRTSHVERRTLNVEQILSSVFWILTPILLLSSCQSRVTDITYPKDIREKKIEITIQLRSSVNTDAYRYYLIFSNDQQPLLPSIGKYIIPPGQEYSPYDMDLEVPNKEGINYFYKNFFYTWSDYAEYYNYAFYLYPSGSHFPQTITVDKHLRYIPNLTFTYTNKSSGPVICLEFTINQLSEMVEKVYFTFITVNNNGDKILDTLDVTQEMLLLSGEKEGSDLEESGIPASADIVKWRIRIF